MSKVPQSLVSFLATTALVAGCATGPNSSSASESTSSSSISRVAGTYRTAVDDTPCPGEDEGTAAARRSIATVRALAGLPPVKCDAAASHAAAAHCHYLAVNHEFTHVETPGRAGFTGVTFLDRLATAQFGREGSIEVLASLTADAAVDDPRGLMNSVYHRAAFLRVENVAFGYGSEGACATIDFGRVHGAPVPTTRTVWPPDGARNVPTTFHADHESPNPVPGSHVVGSPISLFTTDGALADVTVTLTGPQGSVDGVLVTGANDPAKLVRTSELHFVPRAQLSGDTTYRATIRARAGKSANAEAFEISTTFTTAIAEEGDS